MSNNIYVTLGASNHTPNQREINDFYATDPIAVDKLVNAYKLPTKIWECACGAGHLSQRLTELGYDVYATDLVDRGYGFGGVDFLCEMDNKNCDCILTNPPYKYASEFIIHALEILPLNGVCVMFLKTTFLEGQNRYNKIFKIHPPKFVFQFTKRILCAKNGDFQRMIDGGGSAVAYAWFVWEKSFKGDTIIKWI